MSGILFTRTPGLQHSRHRDARHEDQTSQEPRLLGRTGIQSGARNGSLVSLRGATSTAFLVGTGLVLLSQVATAQVFTVGSERMNARFATIKPTNVTLSTDKLAGHTRQELVRHLDAEQGFAMRPLPKGSHGLILHANGDFDPGGSHYLDTLDQKGIAIRAGERVIVSDVKFDRERIIFDLNGGPDEKHRFLKHVQIGIGGMQSAPQGNTNGPVGSRLTLVFDKQVPEMTGAQVEALIAPMIDFGLKTPVQAFTDALPPKLKKAILDHQVLVGMSVEMLIYSKGQPGAKSREMEGQMPFEEWIYGQPPQPTEFVRINGNRVIRVEVAKVGESPIIRAESEVGDTVAPPQQATRTIALGDNHPTQDQIGKAPPSLANPGENLPAAGRSGAMGKVQMPKDDEKPQPLPPPPGQTEPSFPPMTNPMGAPTRRLP